MRKYHKCFNQQSSKSRIKILISNSTIQGHLTPNQSLKYSLGSQEKMISIECHTWARDLYNQKHHNIGFHRNFVRYIVYNIDVNIAGED